MKIKIDKRDRVFSLIIRTRDQWTCQRCFKVFPEGAQNLHCSHFWGRRHQGTRWEEKNADAHCFTCHQYFGENPEDFRAWKLRQLGQNEFDRLAAMHRGHTHFKESELELIYQQLVKRAKAMRIKL